METYDASVDQYITLGCTADMGLVVISGRETAALRRRMQEIGVEFVYEKQPHKIAAFEQVLVKAGVPATAVAFLGDDLPDIPVMKLAGFAVAVGNAAQEVKDIAHYTTRANGGKGAARELIELILKSKGVWDKLI